MKTAKHGEVKCNCSICTKEAEVKILARYDGHEIMKLPAGWAYYTLYADGILMLCCATCLYALTEATDGK